MIRVTPQPEIGGHRRVAFGDPSVRCHSLTFLGDGQIPAPGSAAQPNKRASHSNRSGAHIDRHAPHTQPSSDTRNARVRTDSPPVSRW